ncbi:MAG TPA: CARDB domain-containing protein [Thermomicrobiaceae bacterium]|nr:CARDB domain-containing protein [Thermomicrobiaceae bacterium]
MAKLPRRRGAIALAALLIVLLTQLNLAPLAGAAAPNRGDGQVERVDKTPPGEGHARHPLLLKVRGRDRANDPLVTSTTPYGYTPRQIRSYLGLSGDGSGQTIALVVAYDHPAIVGDLNVFSQQFGLPLVCGTLGASAASCVNFTKATPQGTPTVDSGWALEAALDVEWAHAVAPKAALLLVEAASPYTNSLFAAIDYAARQGAGVISNSWGTGEYWGETSFDSHCALGTAVCTFATGDAGNPGGYPAYSPSVVAVGGTTLNLSDSGGVLSETAWSGSGGGVSRYESRPAYQSQAQSTTHRGIPDVSYDADPSTGFAVYDSVAYSGQSGWFQVGGTSAGAPQWAGILAAANQLRAAQGKTRLAGASSGANSVLYQLGNTLYDVASGANGSCGAVCQAGPGYDFVTGLGSPRAGIDAALAGAGGTAPTPPTPVHDVAVSAISAPGTVTQGQTATVSVTLANPGGYSESVSVALGSSPANAAGTPSPKTIALSPGQSSTVSFAWATASATTAGSYTLTATASISADANSANNSRSTSIQVSAPAQAGGQMYVQSLSLRQQSSRFLSYALGGSVTITSSAGPVANASVQLSLSGPSTSQVFTVTTNAQGVAAFSRTVHLKGSYTLRVQSVNAMGYSYQPSLNQQSSATVSVR